MPQALRESEDQGWQNHEEEDQKWGSAVFEDRSRFGHHGPMGVPHPTFVRGSTYASEEVNIVYKHIMYNNMQYGHDIFFFFFYEWEHRTGKMCPFSSLHPLKKGKEV